jgi:hypothetical protein
MKKQKISVEERIQSLQMRVLVNIEKRQWEAARRNSTKIGRLLWSRTEKQNRHIKKMPIFTGSPEIDAKAELLKKGAM